MKIPIVLLLCFLLALPLSAADKWTSVHSTNFTLVGNATEAQIRALAVELEQFHDAFTQVLGLASRVSTTATVVVVFKNDESFRSSDATAVNGKPGPSGYFQASEDLNYMAIKAGASIPRAVYHQYAHELMRDLPSSTPLWFSEGMAEFFSNFEILTKEKQLAVGKIIPEHMDALQKGPFMSLDDLFKVDRSSPEYNEREMTGIYHAECWALVHYLMVGLTTTRQPQVADFLKLLMSGRPTNESFQSAFKTDTQSMLTDLENYVREKASWQTRATALKDKGTIDKDIKVRTLSDAEAEFYSGDLLMHVNNLSEAGNHLQQAIKLDPKLGAAQAAMGMLYFREDRTEEALNALKRSLALDPQNYLTQYYYAYVLDKNSSSPLDELDAKRGALGKAIELMPRFAAAYELLAYINLTADIDYDTTLELLQNANKYAPANQNIRFLFAQTLVKKKDLDQANKTLQALLTETTMDASLRDGVRNLINYIARNRESENRQFALDEANARREDTAATEAARKRSAEKTSEPAPVPEVEPDPAAGVSAATTTARPKSGELIAVTPQRVRPEGSQVKGMLTLVDCRVGLTLTIKSGNDTIALHTDTPDKIQFVSYVAAVSTSISCGPTPGQGRPVVVTYRPTPGAAAAGEPLVVEFVEN